MAPTSVRLVDGTREMVLYPRDNLIVLNVNTPSPAIRQVTENRTDGDGVLDTTRHFGARNVALDLRAIATPAAFVDELNSFLLPSSRPYLVREDDEWAQARQLRLVSNAWTDPIDADVAPFVRDFQVQWTAPDGTWEATEESILTVSADIPSTTGMSFPVSFPMSFAPTAATGALNIDNVGRAPSNFVAQLYGPITAPRLINNLTGLAIAFTSALVLGAGEYVEIDTYNKTAYLNGVSSQSVLGSLDFDVTPPDWWQIQPREQQLRFTGTSPSVGSQAVIYYRPVWL